MPANDYDSSNYELESAAADDAGPITITTATTNKLESAAADDMVIATGANPWKPMYSLIHEPAPRATPITISPERGAVM